MKPYREGQPLFSRMGIESQLDAMFSPTVQLRSGGYIVINQTEALVSIDVNSGRSTREHHIEDTALKTNLEASEEVARQLRLRDLAGLIVIDFIDMDEKRNNRAVERKLSDCLRHDRARIQVGRISHFGLLEMSRQRIRASVLESSTEPCPHCGGTGHVRSVSSVALQLLRSVEETLMKGATHNLIVRTRTEVALYVLNHKRGHLRDLENGFKVAIAVIADANQQSFVIDHGEQVHTLEAAKALLAAQAAAAKQPIAEAEDEDDELVEGEFETPRARTPRKNRRSRRLPTAAKKQLTATHPAASADDAVVADVAASRASKPRPTKRSRLRSRQTSSSRAKRARARMRSNSKASAARASAAKVNATKANVAKATAAAVGDAVDGAVAAAGVVRRARKDQLQRSLTTLAKQPSSKPLKLRPISIRSRYTAPRFLLRSWTPRQSPLRNPRRSRRSKARLKSPLTLRNQSAAARRCAKRFRSDRTGAIRPPQRLRPKLRLQRPPKANRSWPQIRQASSRAVAGGRAALAAASTSRWTIAAAVTAATSALRCA